MSFSILYIFRLSDYQNSMKYVKILILDVERGLLRLSRFNVSLVVPSGTDISVFEFFVVDFN